MLAMARLRDKYLKYLLIYLVSWVLDMAYKYFHFRSSTSLKILKLFHLGLRLGILKIFYAPKYPLVVTDVAGKKT